MTQIDAALVQVSSGLKYVRINGTQITVTSIREWKWAVVVTLFHFINYESILQKLLHEIYFSYEYISVL